MRDARVQPSIRPAYWFACCRQCQGSDSPYGQFLRARAAEMEMLNIEGDDFHPEWNYTIKPRLMPNS